MPIAVPDLVLAFVFSADALPWLGSFWLLAAGHLVLTLLPYTMSALLADMEELGLEKYEQAAASLGAGFFFRFPPVTPPMLRLGVRSSMLTVAAPSIGEFQLSNLVSGFLSRTYPVVLLPAFYGATGFACAATIVLLTLATIAALSSSLTAALGERREASAT